MRRPGSQGSRQRPGWWNRQEALTKLVIVCLSAVTVLLIVAVILVATLVPGSKSSVASASSTTLGPAAESSTTETTTADQTSATATTAADQAGTTTTSAAAESSSTVATATVDTADHAAEYRSQYPSTESFTNSNWATLDQAPGSHLGATVDVIGRPTGEVTINPSTGYLTWLLSVPAAGGKEMRVLCRTNVNVDRNLLSGGGWVEVRGIAVGTQAAGASTGAIAYVETVGPATEPAATAAS
jgi:hypothetical protein